MKPKPIMNMNKPSVRLPRTMKLPDKKVIIEPKTRLDAVKNDISLLMKSFNTDLSSLDQILKILRVATPEIIDLLSKECTLIFECKICKNLFRSLPNFMTHKRGFCLGKFEEMFQNHEHHDNTWYAKCRKTKTLSSRSTTRKDILSLLETMKGISTEHTASEDVILKDIPTTNEALFNLRYELQEPKEKEVVVVEPVDVGDTSYAPEPIDSSKCNFCNKEFTSQKALNMHTKAEHGDHRICFVCPCCKKYFANTWSVYRHLYKLHRKTNEQVRKLRSQIQKKHVSLEEINRAKKSNMTSPPEERVNQDKAYLEELRGHAALQICSGCGKKFERKVALISHAAHCLKKKSNSSDGDPTLKRKAYAPVKAVNPKKIRLDEEELNQMIIRMKTLDARVVLKKSDIPAKYNTLNDDSSNDGSSAEEKVQSFVQRYNKGDEFVCNKNSFEDLLDKLHSEVRIDDNGDNSDSDYCENDITNNSNVMNGNGANHSDLEDSSELTDSDILLISSGDEDSQEVTSIYKLDRPKIKVEIEEESNIEFVNDEMVDIEDNEIDELESDYHNKNKQPEIEFVQNNKSLLGHRSINNEVSNINDSDSDETIEDNEDENSREGIAEDKEDDEEEIGSDEDESENSEGEETDESFSEESMEEEEVEEEETEDKDACDNSSGQHKSIDIDSNISDSDSKEYIVEYSSSPDNSKQEENSKDYICIDTEREANVVTICQDDMNVKENYYTENGKETCSLEVMESEVLIDDSIDNYDVAKEIVLFNDCEEVCISTVNETDPLEDSIHSNHISDYKHSPLANGDSVSVSSSSPQHMEHDDEVDFDKGDWVTKKINSLMSCPKKKCLLCFKTFQRVNFVRRHVASHYNINKFKCLINSCNFQSYLRSDMTTHLCRIHKKKDFEPYIERLYPTKDDFEQCAYNPDPKPLSSKTSYENHDKNSEFILTSSDKEDGPYSPILVDESDLEIIEETEVATIESKSSPIIPQTNVMQSGDYDSDDNCLMELAESTTSNEKLEKLMFEVIFGSEATNSSVPETDS